jgi:3-oxoacyl-[acyl-carrier-protein] synthase-3
MRKAKIIATGHYAPERVVPNSFFNEMYHEDVDAFLKANRNIYERRYASAAQVTSDLAVEAAQRALAAAQVKASDLDLIIVSTDTPDYISPSTASVVQYKLGAVNAGTFDINTACAGFVTAVDVGSKFIVADEQYKNVLVIGAYLMSRYLDFSDKKIATLFADGAGAAVLTPSDDETGVLHTKLMTDGQYHDYMGIYAGGTAIAVSPEAIANKDHLLRFAKKIPLETNATYWPKLIREVAAAIDIPVSAIDMFFFTQININSINQTLDTLGIPHDRSHNVMNKYGYTGSAAIAMALDDGVQHHRLKRGDIVFLVSSGGGMAMAVSAIRWGYNS